MCTCSSSSFYFPLLGGRSRRFYAISGGEKVSIGTSLGCEGSLSPSTEVSGGSLSLTIGISGGEKVSIGTSLGCEGSLFRRLRCREGLSLRRLGYFILFYFFVISNRIFFSDPRFNLNSSMCTNSSTSIFSV
jgi:hypothetical protein